MPAPKAGALPIWRRPNVFAAKRILQRRPLGALEDEPEVSGRVREVRNPHISIDEPDLMRPYSSISQSIAFVPNVGPVQMNTWPLLLPISRMSLDRSPTLEDVPPKGSRIRV